jgi:hypothetical protein
MSHSSAIRKSSLHAFGIRFAAALALSAAAVFADTPVGSSSGEASFATRGSDPFAMGERVAFVGISAGHYGTYGSTFIPPIHAGFDYAFHQYMTLGGIVGFSQYHHSKEDLTYLTLAARGTFHPTMWFSRIRIPLDPYGHATLGFTHGSYSGPGDYDYSHPVAGVGVGARYWFMPNLAGQAEAGLGRGHSIGSVSLAFKL